MEDPIKYLKTKLISNSKKGGFAYFLETSKIQNEFLDLDFILNHFNISIQYPIKTLKDTSRAKLGKKYKHKDIQLTDTNRQLFLQILFNQPNIGGFKVFFPKQNTDFSTFGREILRYREILFDIQSSKHKMVAVQQLDISHFIKPLKLYSSINKQIKQLKIDIKTFQDEKKINDINNAIIELKLVKENLKNNPQTIISFSFIEKLNKQKIEFIFLEKCITNLADINIGVIDFNIFINKMVSDIYNLHSNNIYHMDIKHLNIMLCNNIFKLIDYGVSYGIPGTNTMEVNNINELHDYISHLPIAGTEFYLNPIIACFMTREYHVDRIIVNLLQSYLLNCKYKGTYNFYKSLISLFMSHYKDYIENGMLNVEKIKNLEPIEFNKFITTLYLRHDWYCLAITILVIYDKFNIKTIPEKKYFERGIKSLMSIYNKKDILDFFGVKNISISS